jgi:hypothetical protein
MNLAILRYKYTHKLNSLHSTTQKRSVSKQDSALTDTRQKAIQGTAEHSLTHSLTEQSPF